MLLYKIFFFNVNMYFFINWCRGGTWSNCLYYLVPTEDQTNASNISKLKQRSTKSDVKKTSIQCLLSFCMIMFKPISPKPNKSEILHYFFFKCFSSSLLSNTPPPFRVLNFTTVFKSKAFVSPDLSDESCIHKR